MLKLVSFQAQHAEAAAALHSLCFPRAWPIEDFQQYALDSNIFGSTALLKGEFAGFILTRKACDEAEVFTIAVQPQFRRQGVAKELLEYIFSLLLHNQTQNVYLEVSEDNHGAEALYKKVGFLKTGERSAYYRTPEGITKAAYLYKKRL